MASGRKSFLDHFRLVDDDDDDYEEDDDYVFEDDDDDDFEDSYRRKKQPPAKPEARTSKPAQKQTFAPPAREPRRTVATSTATDKLVSFDGGASRKPSRQQAASNEVYVIKPQEFDDAQTVTDFLKRGRAIVINMEGLQLEPAQRIIDFIGGACYGIGGELKAISANIFIAVPSSIEVSGDLRDEILSSTGISPHLN
ncbi:cell division inhibitor SepF [Lachnospiraceae bacterium]|nr:cell division inhibitor SepF [Lachnospiraceae bacterium]